MSLFDTHAHLNDPQLLARESQVIADANSAGVSRIVAIGIDLKSSLECLEIARRNHRVYASAGVHPNGCHLANRNQWKEIRQLLSDPHVVAIGETGLDCYWDDCPLQIQQEWFARHIELSHDSGYPLVVHMRNSEEQILESFHRQHRDGRINGIMHSFTGSLETAFACLDYGMYISFAGMVTFKNADNLREIATRIPRDRLLIETDSPYLTPHPFRGRRPNEPKMVIHTAECLADVLRLDFGTFAELTSENAKRVFKITE